MSNVLTGEAIEEMAVPTGEVIDLTINGGPQFGTSKHAPTPSRIIKIPGWVSPCRVRKVRRRPDFSSPLVNI